jgi:hypothetical protein
VILHKILRGEKAGLYLPFGLSRLRALASVYGSSGFFSQKFNIDGHTVEVQQSPPFQYVRIVDNGVTYFEFFTSGNPVELRVAELVEGPTTAYSAATVGVEVSVGAAAIALKPRINKGRRDGAGDGSFTSRIGRPPQANLITEPATGVPTAPARPRGRIDRVLYESFAPMHSHTGVHLRSYNYGGNTLDPLHVNRGPMGAEVQRDVGYDVPWQDSRGSSRVREAFLHGSTDWPRACGVQTVSDPTFGTRTFAISVDAFSQFSVFPTSEIDTSITDGTQNVPAVDVKTAKPTLPSWVFQMPQRFIDWYAANATLGLTEFPEIDWKFNPTSTKACAVVYEREAVTFDSAFFADQPSGSPLNLATFNNYARFDTNFASRQNVPLWQEDAGSTDQRYIAATGLLEISIHITITGVNPEDFTVAYAVSELRRPTTSTLCTFLAGYPWYDIKKPDGTLYAAAGDLCVLDVERYYRPSATPTDFDTLVDYYFVGVLKPDSGASTTILSLKNLTRGTEMRTFPNQPLAEFDLPTMSFVFSHYTTTTTTRTVNKKPASVEAATFDATYTISHPAAVVYTFNTLREILWPETMTQPVKDTITAEVAVDARTTVAGSDWTFMPLNDLRDWHSDADLTEYQNYLSWKIGYRSPSPDPTAPTGPFEAWFCALQTYLPAFSLIYITNPRFGWYSYADALMNVCGKHSYSTFYVHPTGTWAYFDLTRIYNKYGMAFPLKDYDMSAFDATQLEHVVFDRVHFEFPATRAADPPVTNDTTFLQLYNDAVTATTTLIGEFLPMTKASLRAIFTAQTYTTGLRSWLQLQTQWWGTTAYYMETAYQGGTDVDGVQYGGGGLRAPTMEDVFYPEVGYGGNPGTMLSSVYFATVASPLLLAS